MADQLYGQKDLAEFCEYVIASLFEVSPRHSQHHLVAAAAQREGIDTPPYTPPTTITTTAASSSSSAAAAAPALREPPLLVEFIAYALYRTRLPVSIVHQCLLLLSRLKQRYPSARGTSSSPHRLFLSSLMLSAKISMDDTYSNKSWAIVGSNFFTLREVNQMERELFAFLGWNVVASKSELDTFIASADAGYKNAQLALSRESHKRRRVLEEEVRHQQARNAARALLRPHTYNSSGSSHHHHSRRASSSLSPARLAAAATSASSSGTGSSSCSPSMQCSSSSASTSPMLCSYTSSSSGKCPSYLSSASSSTFPSASHSPVSPPSAPLSAGPQTPESANMDVHHHHYHHAHHHPHIHDSPDFPEAAHYVHKQPPSSLAASATKSNNTSPSRHRLAVSTVIA